MRYQTQIYPRVVVVAVVVPLCLRAVVVTALVSQTRGSLAFLGLGVLNPSFDLRGRRLSRCASKGVVKTTAPGGASAGILH